MKLVCSIPLLFALFPLFALADIYRWKDANGKWHFSDTAPANQKADHVSLQQTNRAQALVIKPEKPDYFRADSNTRRDNAADRQQTQMCNDAADKYHRLTRKRNIQATSKRLVLVEDGKPLTRRAQNQRAEQMRHRYNAMGCSIAQTEGLRL